MVYWPWLLILCWLRLVRTCGPLLHNTVAREALYLYSLDGPLPAGQRTAILGAIKKNKRAFQAGAWFPDAGYGCLGLDKAAEYAHWPPFYLRYMTLLHEKYPELRDSHFTSHDLEVSLAFLYGIVSHGVADVSWHSLGRYHGFIDELAIRDLMPGEQNSSWDGLTSSAEAFARAHAIADQGGEAVTAYSTASLDWVESQWTVPLDDVLTIFSQVPEGKGVNAFKLRHCISRGLTAIRAVKIAGARLYDHYASQSLMLATEMESYHNGGSHDMAARTWSCWKALESWLSSKYIANPWLSLCSTFAEKRNRSGSYSYDAAVQSTFSAQRIWPGNGHWETIEHDLTSPRNTLIEADDSGDQLTRIPRSSRAVFGKTPYGQFGTTLAYGTQNARQVLYVSSPFASSSSQTDQIQCGSVIELDLQTLQPTNTLSNSLRNSADSEARLGSSLASTKIDDRVLIAIGSPGSSQVTLQTKASKLNPGSKGDRQRLLSSDSSASSSGTLVRSDVSSFGETILLASLSNDGKRDLVVSAPSSNRVDCPDATADCSKVVLLGQVFVYRNPAYCKNGTQNADAVIEAPERHPSQGFGKALAHDQNSMTLFISAPYFSETDEIGNGKVYGYQSSGSFIPTRPSAILSGPPRSRFGSTLQTIYSADRAYLVVGAPTDPIGARYQAGSVCIYTLVSGVPVMVLKISDSGKDKAAHFGSAMTYCPGRQTLWISAPNEDRAAGAVYGYDFSLLDRKIQRGSDEPVAPFATLKGHGREHYGSSLLCVDDLHSKTHRLVIGANRNSELIELGGKIYIEDLDSLD